MEHLATCEMCEKYASGIEELEEWDNITLLGDWLCDSCIEYIRGNPEPDWLYGGGISK